MAPKWQNITVTLPVDGATVWTRILYQETPFQAVWSLSEQTYTLPNGLIVPWFYAPMWRALS